MRRGILLLSILTVCVGFPAFAEPNDPSCAEDFVLTVPVVRRAILAATGSLAIRGLPASDFYGALAQWESDLVSGAVSLSTAKLAATEAHTAQALGIPLPQARRLLARVRRRLVRTAAPSDAAEIMAVLIRDSSPWKARLFPGSVAAPLPTHLPLQAAQMVAEDGAWAVDVWRALALLPEKSTTETTTEWIERHKDQIPYLWGAVAESMLLGEDEHLLPGPAVRIEGQRHADAWEADVVDDKLLVKRMVEAKASLAGIERAATQPSGFVERLFATETPVIELFGRSFPAARLQFQLPGGVQSFHDTRTALSARCAAFPQCEPDELQAVFGPDFFAVAFPSEQATFLGKRGPPLYPTTPSRDELVLGLTEVLGHLLGEPVTLSAVVRAIGSARRHSRHPLPVWDAFRRRTQRDNRFVPLRKPQYEELSWLASISEFRRGALGSGFVSNPVRFFTELLQLLVPESTADRAIITGVLQHHLKRRDVERALKGRRKSLERVRQAIALVEVARGRAQLAAVEQVGTTGELNGHSVADVVLDWHEAVEKLAIQSRPPAEKGGGANTHRIRVRGQVVISDERLRRFVDRQLGSAQWLTEFSQNIRMSGHGYARDTLPFFRRIVGLADESRRDALQERLTAVGIRQWDAISVTRLARNNAHKSWPCARIEFCPDISGTRTNTSRRWCARFPMMSQTLRK